LYHKIPLGVEKIDRLLQGGIPAGKTSITYGPPSSGKTIIAIAATKTFTSRNGIAYYIDTELKTAREYVVPAVYVEAVDISRLLDTLLDILKKARHVEPLLVVVDSISAVMHPLTINNPDYAGEKIRSLAHIARQLNQENVTLLVASLHLGGYHGKYLNPALVIRSEKSYNGFRLVVEYGEDMLTPVEELITIGEVISIALARPFQTKED
jgi:KaiC/GvpD/RAD55 family RecA-like ATPase